MQSLKPQRNFQTTSARHIIALREIPMTTQEIAAEFGVTSNSVNLWLKDNKAPYWTKLASECLRRRIKQFNTDKLMLLKVPKEHLKTIELLTKGLEIDCKFIE